jgi:hypothetical protein
MIRPISGSMAGQNVINCNNGDRNSNERKTMPVTERVG